MRIEQVLFFVMAAGIVFSCNAQSSQNEKQTEVKESDKVTVYYFHMTRRCATCKAVENVSRKAVQEMDNSNVRFTGYNVEKSEGEKIAKKMNVSGQALLIVGGDQKINITREGFMFARTKPDKLKEVVQQRINSLQ